MLIAVCAGLFFINLRFAAQNPGGNDFLSRWVGTRVFFTRGTSPYSDQATSAIQEMAYGRPARSNEDQMLFVYPLYTILVMAPFALIGDYVTARALWMTVLEIVLIVLALFGVSLTRWRVPRLLLIALLLFAALWYHGLRPVINGNPAVMVSLFVWMAILAIRAEQDALAGFLLAISTIKPQMVVLLILFTLLWAISHHRWRIVWSFWGSLGLIIAGMILLIPDWVLQNIRQVLAYPQYTLPGTPGAILAGWLPGIGNQLGWLLTVICSVVLVIEWRAAWRQDFSWYLWTAGLTMTLSNLIGIRTATENYILLFPVLIIVLAVWDERWGKFGRALVIASLGGLVFWSLVFVSEDNPDL